MTEPRDQPSSTGHHCQGQRYLWAVTLGMLIGMLGGAVGCERSQYRTPPNRLVALVEARIKDLDPRFATSNTDTKLSQLVFMGLTTVDRPDLEPALALARSIEEVEPLVYAVTLRDDAKFSDGSPVMATDVVHTYDRAMDPDGGSLFARGFRERYAAVEAAGPRVVLFRLHKPLATLWSDMAFGILSEKSGAGEAPMGAGPFRVVRGSGEGVLLARNVHFFGPPPSIDEVEVRVVRDSNARVLMLVGGSADFAQNAVRLDLVDEVAKTPRLDVEVGPGAILTYLMMQNRDPLLADVRVRRAIAHAVDRELIVKAKFRGRARLATGLLPGAHWAYEGDVPRYRFDPDKARALLDEAGYPDPDGPGGKPRLRLTYKTSADQFRVAIARIIASQLSDVGIEVEVRSFEFGTFFADIKQGNFQLASMQTAPILEPNYLYSYFHSERIPTKENPNHGNRWRYVSADVDRWTEQGREESDRAKRRALYSKVQRQLATDVPIVPLWHEDNVAIMNKLVTGYELLPSARFHGFGTLSKAPAKNP